MKQRTGYLFKDKTTGKWVARVTFTDESGKRRNVKRYCESKTEARDKLDALKRDIKERGQQSIEGDKMRFREVAERYEQTKLIEPVYVDGKKVAGMRSLYTPKLYVKTLVEHFGNKRVRAITHADIEAYKLTRLRTPIIYGKEGEKKERPRTLAGVNRELETLRAMLNFAVRQGWILTSPFTRGEALIDRGAENSRDRTLSFEEESRLLAACVGKRTHLHALIITALDSGMRRGELFKLEWQDVDFRTRTITLRAIITKTNKPRNVAMTDRVHDELLRLYEASPQQKNDRVFGLTDNVKKGWAAACKAAKIEGLRFHDLRHTFVSRLIAAGIPHTEAMKLSGHTTLAMLNRYLNPDANSAQRAADALDAFRKDADRATVSTFVN